MKNVLQMKQWYEAQNATCNNAIIVRSFIKLSNLCLGY
jgi:hypothetical protein